MAHCSSCGRTVEEYELRYVGGEPVCISCESTPHGMGADVPCQRCGIYVPPHELKMFRSRLYCNYCIMDMEDEARAEEKAIRKRARHEEEEIRAGKPLGGHCEMCGAEAGVLYALSGKKVCKICLEKSGAGGVPPSESFFGSAVRIVSKVADRLFGKNIVVNEEARIRQESEEVEKFMGENREMLEAYPLKIEGQDSLLADYYEKLSGEEKLRFLEGYLALVFSDNEEFELGVRVEAIEPERQVELIRAVYFLCPESRHGRVVPRRIEFSEVEKLVAAAEKGK